MLAGVVELGDPLVGVRRQVSADCAGVTGDLLDQPAVAVGIVVVVLVEPRTGTHVEQMLQRAPFPRRASQLRDVVGHEPIEFDSALPDKHAGERRRQRLRHRHQQVCVGGAHASAVVLERDDIVDDDHQPVGERCLQHLVEPPPSLEVIEGEPADVVAADAAGDRPPTATRRCAPCASAREREGNPTDCEARLSSCWSRCHLASLRRLDAPHAKPGVDILYNPTTSMEGVPCSLTA